MVLNPPLLRPMACDSPFFARPSAMLVGAHDGGIDHGVFVVGVFGQMLEDFFPYAARGPAAETRMHHAEIAKPLRQVAPRNPSPVAIQHRIDEQPVVHGWTPDGTVPPWKKPFDSLPRIVPQSVTPNTHPQKLKKPKAQAYIEFDDTP